MLRALVRKALRVRKQREHRDNTCLFIGLEPLEDRVLLSTTLFLDFGAGIGMGNTLSTTVNAFLNIDGAGANGAGTGADLTGQGMAGGDSLDMTPIAFDFDLDGDTDNNDITALSNAVVPLVQRVLEPFDIDIQVVGATSLADMVTFMDANNGDASGEFDAYNVILDINSDAFGGGSVGINTSLFGLAAWDDASVQLGNLQDEATLTFADNVLSSTSGTMGTAQFAQNFAQRIAYTATHEGFHTFTYRHTPDESGGGASANQRLLASGDVIRRGSNTRENPFIVTRYDLLHGGAPPEPNNYLTAANDGDIGLRDADSSGRPDLAYATGTGANDQVTFTDAGGGIVNVAVNPYSNQARTNLIGAGETYTIDLSADTDGEILVDASINADEVVIDATIVADFRARGGVGSDSAVSATADQDLLTLNSGGLMGAFTPGADGINGTVIYGSGATVVFTEFEDVEADNISIDTITLDLSSGNAVLEGEQFTLDVEFVNIDTLDSHEIVVDWGNGETSMTTLVAGDRDASFIYTYEDDHPLSGTAADGFTISVMITDDDGDSGTANAGMLVSNVDPTIQSISLSASSIDEADSVTVSGIFTDPALGVSTETFTGTALWSDGVATILTIDGTSGTFSTSRTFLDDHPMTGTPSDTFTVDITINDDDTGTDTGVSPTLTVNNVDPVITSFASDATFEDKAEEGEPVNIMGTFTDVGILDTHVAEVDWGDGMVETVTVIQGAGFGTITGSHAYDAGGIYTITITLTDDDTGSHTASTIAVVTGVGLNNGVLYIIGSSEDDSSHVEQTGTGTMKVHASFIPENFRTFDASAVDQIISYLCEGDDHLTIANGVTAPVIVHGGGGNDHLHAGGGVSVLLGDSGDDELIGQGDRNILIGGTGQDKLVGGRDDDILIGGSTTSDGDDTALLAAAIAWSDLGQSYNNRVLAVAGLLSGVDDSEIDILRGSAGQDLFYAGLDDVFKDLKANETVN